MPSDIRTTKFDIPALFNRVLCRRLGYENVVDALSILPSPEPEFPSGIVYRVAEPYVPEESLKNVMDALQTKNISSASIWPKCLGEKLSELFGMPVN